MRRRQLDVALTADVNILRERIEATNREHSAARRRFEAARVEYEASQQEVERLGEVKEKLTDHLMLIIQEVRRLRRRCGAAVHRRPLSWQSEARKASKLEALSALAAASPHRAPGSPRAQWKRWRSPRTRPSPLRSGRPNWRPPNAPAPPWLAQQMIRWQPPTRVEQRLKQIEAGRL